LTACLAHARRKYIEAVKVDPKDEASAGIVSLMEELFAINAKALDQQMNLAQRNDLRNRRMLMLRPRICIHHASTEESGLVGTRNASDS
jgi:hypothetical protein